MIWFDYHKALWTRMAEIIIAALYSEKKMVSCCDKEAPKGQDLCPFHLRVQREVGRPGWLCTMKLSEHGGSLHLVAPSAHRALLSSTWLKLFHHHNQVQGEREGQVFLFLGNNLEVAHVTSSHVSLAQTESHGHTSFNGRLGGIISS